MNKRFLQNSPGAGHLMLIAGIIWIVVIAAFFVWNRHHVGDSMGVSLIFSGRFVRHDYHFKCPVT